MPSQVIEPTLLPYGSRRRKRKNLVSGMMEEWEPDITEDPSFTRIIEGVSGELEPEGTISQYTPRGY